MAIPTEPVLKRRLRTIAAWAEDDQPALADAVGVKYTTFKGYFSAGKPGPPLDVVLAVAEHAGVPRDFVLDGWEAISSMDRRLAALEARIDQAGG